MRFFEIEHDDLPDIIAYSAKRNWLYLIEAVYSSGPISDERRLELQRLTANCTAPIIYVTAFADRQRYRRWVDKLAWETEIWLAAEPDHLMHLNGHKFLGPYPAP